MTKGKLFFEEPINDVSIREAVLKLVHPRLVNAKAFAQDLEEMPHRTFFSELAVVYCCYSDDPEQDAILHIGNWINEVTDITEEDLYQAAIRNSAGLWTAIDFADLLISHGESNFMAALTYKDFAPFGAAAILHEAALKQTSSVLGGDFWAMPSSIHEFVCLRADPDADPADLKQLVGAVNNSGMEEIITEYEILGETPLYYDSREGVLKEVTA